MRLLLIAALFGVVFVGFPASTSCLPATAGKRQAGPMGTAEEPAPFGMHGAGRSGGQSGDWRSQEQQPPDISRSGRDFLEVCSSVGNEGVGSEGAGSEGSRDAARTARDATCLGWVAGFAEGFLVHDELLGIPKRDRLACVPNGESAIQIFRVMKRYLANNPEKAHRATRYIASLALAKAFPCRGGK